jgi:DNA-binding transcriptional regulator PaaX
MFRWGYAIREILSHSQDEADLEDIYDNLENHFPLDDDDKRETRYGGRAAYKHVTRSVISNLVKEGDLSRVRRARYRLTDQGRARYAAERET